MRKKEQKCWYVSTLQFVLFICVKDPSFHVSVAWLLGDICSTERDKLQTQLQVKPS